MPLFFLAAGDAHGNISVVLLALAVVLLAGKFAGSLAERLGQPGVLGELIAGIVIGNLGLVGFGGLEFLRSHETVLMMAEVGVILLLFGAGMESTVTEMLR